jgi:hypothetical protein
MITIQARNSPSRSIAVGATLSATDILGTEKVAVGREALTPCKVRGGQRGVDAM